MSPECELVALLSRITPRADHLARARTLAGGALDWTRVHSLAVDHRVAPLFSSNALQLELPASIGAGLRELRRTTTAADLRHFDLWLALVAAFQTRGIRAVTLRGFPAALTVYGKIGRRQVPKLDILIGRPDLSAALPVLAAFGYQLESPLHPTQTAATLVSDHGRLALRWDADDLLATAVPLSLREQTVLVPPHLTTVALLLAHGHASSWERLGYLVDLAESLDQLSEVEYAQVRQQANDAGQGPVLDEALRRIDGLWGRRPRAESPFTFVSAIYDSGPSSLLGGRGWNIQFYLPSLINIGRMGAPLVLFCAPHDVDRIEAAIAPYFCDCRVVPYELEQFDYFEPFLAWKRTYWKNLQINDRNEVLCFLKSWWLQRAIADNPFGHDLFFWIDAGLTHHGLFPRRLGGVELLVTYPPSHYHPDNPLTLFTPALGAALTRAVAPGTVLFCAQPFSNPATRAAFEAVVAPLAGAPARITDHLVGGLFGGRRADVTRVHGVYVEVLKRCIATRTYTLEEQVFSGVHALHPELFSLQRFDTWQYFAPGERLSRLPAEGNSFYKIFTRLLGAAPMI